LDFRKSHRNAGILPASFFLFCEKYRTQGENTGKVKGRMQARCPRSVNKFVSI
jgi:hypothetical protein